MQATELRSRRGGRSQDQEARDAPASSEEPQPNPRKEPKTSPSPLPIPQRYQRRRILGCLMLGLVALIVTDAALQLRQPLGNPAPIMVLGVLSFVYTFVLSAFFPEDDTIPNFLTTSVLLASLIVNVHLSIVEWAPRANQTELHLVVRRAVMLFQCFILSLILLMHAAREIKPWTAIRMIWFSFGVIDLAHTAWLHVEFINSPQPRSQLAVAYLSGVQVGPPSFWLCGWLCIMGFLFSTHVRRIIARKTGLARLALDLGELTHSDFHALAPNVGRVDKRSWAHALFSPPERPSSSSAQDGVHRRWGSDPAVDEVSSSSHSSTPRKQSFSKKSESSQASSKNTHWSWGDYGRSWEREWQEQREREIESERSERMLRDAQAGSPGILRPSRSDNDKAGTPETRK
jgi:hypothetical protein